MSDTVPKLLVRKVPVLPVRVRIHCECGGEMLFADVPVAVHPRTYKHKCDKCSSEVLLPEAFPKIEYEELPDESAEN